MYSIQMKTDCYIGDKIYYIYEGDASLRCKKCDGDGLVKASFREEGTWQKNSGYTFFEPHPPCFHQSVPKKICEDCNGIGRIKIKGKEWFVSEEFIVEKINLSIDNKGKVSISSLVLKDEYKEKEISYEYCFTSKEIAEEECEKRNILILYSVTAFHNQILFEDIEKAMNWINNFTLNSLKGIGEPDGNYPSYHKKALENGISIKPITINKKEYEKIPDFGGYKILSGSPVFNELQFGESKHKTNEEVEEDED